MVGETQISAGAAGHLALSYALDAAALGVYIAFRRLRVRSVARLEDET